MNEEFKNDFMMCHFVACEQWESDAEKISNIVNDNLEKVDLRYIMAALDVLEVVSGIEVSESVAACSSNLFLKIKEEMVTKKVKGELQTMPINVCKISHLPNSQYRSIPDFLDEIMGKLDNKDFEAIINQIVVAVNVLLVEFKYKSIIVNPIDRERISPDIDIIDGFSSYTDVRR